MLHYTKTLNLFLLRETIYFPREVNQPRGGGKLNAAGKVEDVTKTNFYDVPSFENQRNKKAMFFRNYI